MTWFKMDDAWWSHRKVLPLSLEARGLWVTVASWSSQHLSDGVVEWSTVESIVPRTSSKRLKALALELEAQGLWIVSPTEIRFHDWTQHQQSRAQVEAKRAADSARKTQRLAQGIRAESERNPSGKSSDAKRNPRPRSYTDTNPPKSPAHRSVAETLADLEAKIQADDLTPTAEAS